MSLFPAKRDEFLFNPFEILDGFTNDRWFPSIKTNFFKQIGFKIDVIEEDNGYIVQAELPGIKKEDVNISFKNDYITICVEQKEEKKQEDKKYTHQERYHSSMRRDILLDNANFDKSVAKMNDGILEINIPKQSSISKINKINIE